MVYFYPKDDTSGCTAEAIAFNGLRAEIRRRRRDRHRRFARQRGRATTSSSASTISKIALAADPERSAIEAYGVWKEKSMYGRKYFGVERSTFLIGRDGRIARIWRKVKVPGHAEEVLAAVKAL